MPMILFPHKKNGIPAFAGMTAFLKTNHQLLKNKGRFLFRTENTPLPIKAFLKKGRHPRALVPPPLLRAKRQSGDPVWFFPLFFWRGESC